MVAPIPHQHRSIAELDHLVRGFAEAGAGVQPNTVRVYRRQWKHWTAWCLERDLHEVDACIPATVGEFLLSRWPEGASSDSTRQAVRAIAWTLTSDHGRTWPAQGTPEREGLAALRQELSVAYAARPRGRARGPRPLDASELLSLWTAPARRPTPRERLVQAYLAIDRAIGVEYDITWIDLARIPLDAATIGDDHLNLDLGPERGRVRLEERTNAPVNVAELCPVTAVKALDWPHIGARPYLLGVTADERTAAPIQHRPGHLDVKAVLESAAGKRSTWQLPVHGHADPTPTVGRWRGRLSDADLDRLIVVAQRGLPRHLRDRVFLSWLCSAARRAADGFWLDWRHIIRSQTPHETGLVVTIPVQKPRGRRAKPVGVLGAPGTSFDAVAPWDDWRWLLNPEPDHAVFARLRLVRSNAGGPVRLGSETSTGGMTPGALSHHATRALRDLSERAGVDPRRITSYTGRKTVSKHAHEQGAAIFELADYLHHVFSETTLTYYLEQQPVPVLTMTMKAA